MMLLLACAFAAADIRADAGAADTARIPLSNTLLQHLTPNAKYCYCPLW